MARLVHKILVSSFVHRESSQEKVHTPDLWLLEMIMGNKEKRKFSMNVLWTLAVYLSRRATLMTDVGFINGGHYVTRIAKSLGYDTNVEKIRFR